MTDKEAVTAFKRVLKESEEEEWSNAEWVHRDGDQFMAQFVQDLGFPKLAAEYRERMTYWWYS